MNLSCITINSFNSINCQRNYLCSRKIHLNIFSPSTDKSNNNSLLICIRKQFDGLLLRYNLVIIVGKKFKNIWLIQYRGAQEISHSSVSKICNSFNAATVKNWELTADRAFLRFLKGRRERESPVSHYILKRSKCITNNIMKWIPQCHVSQEYYLLFSTENTRSPASRKLSFSLLLSTRMNLSIYSLI